MLNRKTESVMTADVVHVRDTAGFKDVAELLAEHRISGLPVVDADLRVLGIVSESDLVLHQAQQRDDWLQAPRGRRWIRSRAARRQTAKARATTAGELMTAPPRTVSPDTPLTEAARTMARHSIDRLPVTDAGGHLVGIITRHDLLQVFLRPDADIRAEVMDEVLVRNLWLAPHSIAVTVHDGVVTLKGQLERRSQITSAVWMTGQIDGVVAVLDELSYALDDTNLRLTEAEKEELRNL
jgi:CBS domain-containing protein